MRKLRLWEKERKRQKNKKKTIGCELRLRRDEKRRKTQNDGIFIASSGICPTWSYHKRSQSLTLFLSTKEKLLRVFSESRHKLAIMQQLPANSTFIDSSINKSIDFISTAIHQLFQFIFCLMSIMVVGKLINFFLSKTSIAEIEEEVTVQNVKAEQENEASIEKKGVPITGWDSEPLQESSLPSHDPPSSIITSKTMKKQLRRKCMSVGPVMLTPTSQIVRTLDVEDREERYRFDILPLDAPSNANESETAENVCVPNKILY